MMDRATAEALRDIGRTISPDNAKSTNAIYSSRHQAVNSCGIAVDRDLAYGPDPRNRLDIFLPAEQQDAAIGVLVFVHGGSFIAGDKNAPGSPYYSNVGEWAVQQGFAGVTVNYRLAPGSQYPSAIEDLDQVVAWLQDHADDLGIDPGKIVVAGASAGATHVAQWVTAGRGRDSSVSGIVLLSGVYDFTALESDPVLATYYGADAPLVELSPHLGIAESEIPLMLVVSELDPPGHQQQFLDLARLRLEHNGRMPHLAYLPHHNHFSEVLHLGTADQSLGCSLKSFISTLGRDQT